MSKPKERPELFAVGTHIQYLQGGNSENGSIEDVAITGPILAHCLLGKSMFDLIHNHFGKDAKIMSYVVDRSTRYDRYLIKRDRPAHMVFGTPQTNKCYKSKNPSLTSVSVHTDSFDLSGKELRNSLGRISLKPGQIYKFGPDAIKIFNLNLKSMFFDPNAISLPAGEYRLSGNTLERLCTDEQKK